MSYPRKLQILVIEDEQSPIEGYKTLFAEFQADVPHVEPVYARSYTDGRARIESATIFHLVILDLNLPLATREDPEAGLSAGEALLDLLARRDAYPVPVVLVVSGKLNTANLPDLRRKLSEEFWYGQFVNKASAGEADEIRRGLEKAQQYCDVGIHLRDAGPNWFPTFTPRDDDLLRRCVLSQTHCLGVDLAWWGAEEGPSISRPPGKVGPTNVLVGHFILDGHGNSIPTFFKFEPATNAPAVCRDAGILAHKLGHVKVYHTAHAHSRGLLVTQSVTNHGRPTSLNEFLRGDPRSVGPTLGKVVDDVLAQLALLGDGAPDQVPVKSLLWKYLDRDKVAAGWGQTGTRDQFKMGLESPMAAYDRIASNDDLIWVKTRGCIHGDLNATNVAIDTTVPEKPQAYIFDAAGMHPDVDLRDLATLEVTTVLFNATGADQRLVFYTRAFYEDAVCPSAVTIPDDATPLVTNALMLLVAIRERVKAAGAEKAYALLVFNAVMMQLFGIAVQPERNKVASPFHAAMLGSWVGGWVTIVAPEFAGPKGTPS